jgi:hypothetical protein
MGLGLGLESPERVFETDVGSIAIPNNQKGERR